MMNSDSFSAQDQGDAEKQVNRSESPIFGATPDRANRMFSGDEFTPAVPRNEGLSPNTAQQDAQMLSADDFLEGVQPPPDSNLRVLKEKLKKASRALTKQDENHKFINNFFELSAIGSKYCNWKR